MAAQGRRASLTADHPGGRADGWRLGWDDGYWSGQCAAAAADASRPPAKRDVHVLYVATGKGYPYSPLDEAVCEALHAAAGRVSVTDAHGDAAGEAQRLRPDLVLVLDGMNLPPEQVDAIRAADIRTAVWFTDDPYYTDTTGRLAPHYDDVFTLERSCVAFYRGIGCANVHHLPLGVSASAFRHRNAPPHRRHDITFVGSAFWNRVAFFERLSGLLEDQDLYVTGLWWERMQSGSQARARFETGVWMTPAETAITYSGSKIAINLHRAEVDPTFNCNSAGIGAVSPNPRSFEIAACGTLQLTDVREDLALYFEPDREIVTYTSPEELADKARYYLAHEEERRRIALRAIRRTMRDHTYERRIEEMLRILFG